MNFSSGIIDQQDLVFTLVYPLFYSLQLLDGLLTEYESMSYGPGKWRKLATFLQQWYIPLILLVMLILNVDITK
jgi:hypothetical protein